jgi:hypothetical protein
MANKPIDIVIIHTASDEHILTAFDRDGNGICSLLDPDKETVGNITDAIDGEHTATLIAVEVDVDNDPGALHTAMYNAAFIEWPPSKAKCCSCDKPLVAATVIDADGDWWCAECALQYVSTKTF